MVAEAGPGLTAELVVTRPGFRLDCRLAVEPGEVVALLGPNGAGKTTALRALAGLVRLDAGAVRLGGRVLAEASQGLHRPAAERGLGVVFQDYLLFPHLDVLDNVAFGVRAGGARLREARRTAHGWLERLEVTELHHARPRQLSGGQAQRVALARALATDPAMLLLDEPLAALDARTRLVVRAELRRFLRDYPRPALVVTHDPVDAAVLADRLVVLEGGQVVQEGTPAEVARRPRTDYVARLVGLNLLSGRAQGHRVAVLGGGQVVLAEPASGPVNVAFRPSAVALFRARPDGSPRNLWPARVVNFEPHGEGVRVELSGLAGAPPALIAEITAAALADLELAPGDSVWAAVKASDVEVYPLAP